MAVKTSAVMTGVGMLVAGSGLAFGVPLFAWAVWNYLVAHFWAVPGLSYGQAMLLVLAILVLGWMGIRLVIRWHGYADERDEAVRLRLRQLGLDQ